MWTSCGSTSVGIAVGVLLLVFLLAYAIGCAWPWKYSDTPRLALPSFLPRRSSRRKDHPKTFCWSSRISDPSPRTSDETKGHTTAIKGARTHNNYENIEAGPPKDKDQPEEALYENARQSSVEEHVYGNQTSSHYYNFQRAPCSSQVQEEDIYILPD